MRLIAIILPLMFGLVGTAVAISFLMLSLNTRQLSEVAIRSSS